MMRPNKVLSDAATIIHDKSNREGRVLQDPDTAIPKLTSKLPRKGIRRSRDVSPEEKGESWMPPDEKALGRAFADANGNRDLELRGGKAF